MKTLADAGELVDFAFKDSIRYDPTMLIAKGLDAVGSLLALEAAHRRLAEMPFSENEIEQPLRSLADELGLKAGQLFGIFPRGPDRQSRSRRRSSAQSPGPWPEATLARLAQAEAHLRDLATASASTGANRGVGA